MNDENGNTSNWEKRLATALKSSLESKDKTPPFDAVFAAAERRRRDSKRQYAGLAGAAMVAAVAVAVVFMINAGAPTPDSPALPKLLQVAELMDSTDWSAPSDVLLPTHEFDIYQELPVLLESTKPAEGALL
ncbi:MAG: hypothetical protein OER97_05670 [Gammaproteobacteria bacterium]|nr:hypothetical protein [Gammaproteobacteria bacterium]